MFLGWEFPFSRMDPEGNFLIMTWGARFLTDVWRVILIYSCQLNTHTKFIDGFILELESWYIWESISCTGISPEGFCFLGTFSIGVILSCSIVLASTLCPCGCFSDKQNKNAETADLLWSILIEYVSREGLVCHGCLWQQIMICSRPIKGVLCVIKCPDLSRCKDKKGQMVRTDEKSFGHGKYCTAEIWSKQNTQLRSYHKMCWFETGVKSKCCL